MQLMKGEGAALSCQPLRFHYYETKLTKGLGSVQHEHSIRIPVNVCASRANIDEGNGRCCCSMEMNVGFADIIE